MGWSISGLSAITRVGNTIYNDNKVDGITLTTSDRFALDGNRLVVTGGNYGVAGSLYRTEVESFKDITANGTLGGGPLSFTVKDQNGMTYEYGGTNGYVMAQGSNTPYTWLLKKVTDLNGNLMTINYSIYDGAAFPTEIAYNKNVNNTAAATTFVYFIYGGSQNFQNFGYIAGGKISSYTVLQGINVVYNNGTNQDFRSYDLDYEIDFYPHLKSVTERGAGGAEFLKPTEFTYGNVQPNSQATTVGGTQGGAEFAMGDYNGDGKTDLIQFPKTYTSSNNNWQLYLNTGNQFTPTQSGALPPIPTQYSGENEGLFPRNYSQALFDFNGDGKDDFMYQSSFFDYPGSTQPHLQLNILLSNGTSLNPLTPKLVHKIFNHSTPLVNAFNRNLPYPGDFDGDGKTEILYLNTIILDWGNPSPDYYNNFLIGERYLKPTSYNGENVLLCETLQGMSFDAAYVETEASKIYVIDYDGDGKNEILSLWRDDASNVNHAQVFKLNVSFDANNNPIVGNPAFVMVNESNYPPLAWETLTGDFNGDHITDYLSNVLGNFWVIANGDGTGKTDAFVQAPSMNQYKFVTSSNNKFYRSLFVADFNGDGKSDIFDNSEDSYFGSYQLPRIHYSKGNNAFSLENLSTSQNYFGPQRQHYWLGDYNGDGSADVLTYRLATDSVKTIVFHPNETRHLLSKVKNGLDSETKISYQSLANSSVYSSGSNTYAYPYIKRTIPFKVVSTVNSDNGINSTGNNTTYTYSGLKFHAHGKGLMGFDKVVVFDQSNLIEIKKTFGLNTEFAFPYLNGSIIIDNNTTINTSNISYGVYHYGNKRIFPYQTVSEQYNALTGEAVQTTNNFVFPSGPIIPMGVVYSHTYHR